VLTAEAVNMRKVLVVKLQYTTGVTQVNTYDNVIPQDSTTDTRNTL